MSDSHEIPTSLPGDENAPEAAPESKSETAASRSLSNFISGRSGTRTYSFRALIEQVADAFAVEYADTPALREADTTAKRLALLVETANYIFAVESVRLSADERAAIIEAAYGELFSYGPLDPLLSDPNITTILLKGSRHVSVRYGHGELRGLGQGVSATLFEDETHARTIIERMVADADAELVEDTYILEAGLKLGQRKARITVVPPSLAFEISADIRLHPAQWPTLDELAANGGMTDESAAFIRAILRSRYGVAIVGEPETGKTVLLNAIARELFDTGLSDPKTTIAVQRADEMPLTPEVQSFSPKWPKGSRSGTTFGERIDEALETRPATLLLDEVRADEPGTIAPLLMADDSPRQFWVVRGAPDAKRLQSALGMLARRAAVGQGETLVHALYERLPFVITVARIRERLQIFSVAEWQSRVDSDYPDYVMLMRYEDGAARSTGARSARWIDSGIGKD